jgi:sugar-specific transcriptional regulator TrmB
MHLEKILKQLGFSDKESKVYLAALELGPQPVQEIAKRAGVNRATTYVMIESLTQRGLMSSMEKGKKRYFTAESADRLFNIVNAEKEAATAKEELIEKIMPDLRALTASSESKPRVRFYEGVEGLKAIMQDFTESKVDYIEHALDVDEFRKHFSDEDFPEHREKLIKSKVKFKGLITTSGSPPALIAESEVFSKQFRYVPKEKFVFPGEMVIYGDKVAILTFKGKVMGVIIESHEIKQMLSTLFNMAWESAK